MIFVYTALLIVLVVTRFLVKRQAASLEKKYTRAAVDAEQLARQAPHKEGNSARYDTYQIAKRQYLLGQAVQKRDRIESRYTVWQARAERLERMSKSLRAWKGKALPYTCGLLDVALVLTLIDYLGAGQYLNARTLYDTVRTWFAH
jgi:hypothetical protein